MSENFPSAIILARTSREAATAIAGRSLEMLVAELDFGFRGWGGPLQLFFEDGRYDEDILDEPLTQADLHAATVERLARTYDWFSLQGSVRLPGVDRLCSLDVTLYPSPDPARPACVVFGLDSWFYESIHGRDFDRFDSEAAELFVKMSVRLGANPLADGFMSVQIPSLAAVETFDANQLREVLLTPREAPSSWDEALAQRHLRPGLVTGVRSDLVPFVEVQRRWPDGVTLQTSTGFSVLSVLVAVPDELIETSG